MQALLGHCTLEAFTCGWTSPVHGAGILSPVTPYPTRAGLPNEGSALFFNGIRENHQLLILWGALERLWIRL